MAIFSKKERFIAQEKATAETLDYCLYSFITISERTQAVKDHRMFSSLNFQI